MRAGDLAAPFPAVTFSTTGLDAARLLAGQDLPGLIVVDRNGVPNTVLSGTQVLRMTIPSYCQDDPALARVIDEDAADVFVRGMGERTVEELLPRPLHDLAVVDADATVLEVAAEMAATKLPLVAVTAEDHSMLGAITLDALLDRMLGT
jgi:predicted transcriptional regulator